MAKRKAVLISDQLREAIKASKLPQKELCEKAGIEPAVLSRFMTGALSATGRPHGLSLETIDRLGPIVGVQLTSRPKQRR